MIYVTKGGNYTVRHSRQNCKKKNKLNQYDVLYYFHLEINAKPWTLKIKFSISNQKRL